MTGPVHLGAAWILLLVIVGLIAMCWAFYRYVKDVIPFEQGEPRPDFGIHKESEEPVRNEGGGYDWEDGRTTRDREGKEEIRR